jgi:hypothetical protein
MPFNYTPIGYASYVHEFREVAIKARVEIHELEQSRFIEGTVIGGERQGRWIRRRCGGCIVVIPAYAIKFV